MTLSDRDFDTLRDAVRLARDEQIQSVEQLRNRLVAVGHEPVHIEAALATWAEFVRRK